MIGALFSGPPLGIGMLAAGIILAIMIIPFIASVMRDVFEVTPAMLKESAYGVGGNTWEVVWNVVLPYTKVGVIGGIMLGLGRALGETMAVTFVIGNTNFLSNISLFAPGNSITSALANEFGEAPPGLYTASLIELGLILFLITLTVLVLSRLLLLRLSKQEGSTDLRRRWNCLPRRKLINKVALGLSMAAMAFGLFWLVWILLTTLQLGVAGLSVELFTKMTPPPGAASRRPAQCHRRQRDHGVAGHRAGYADRHPGRHLSGRIRPAHLAGPRDALHQRHPAVGAVHRHRPVRLCDLRRQGGQFLRAFAACSRWR